jgi:hypothetical protein
MKTRLGTSKALMPPPATVVGDEVTRLKSSETPTPTAKLEPGVLVSYNSSDWLFTPLHAAACL